MDLLDPTTGTALVLGGLLAAVVYVTLNPLRSHDKWHNETTEYDSVPIGLRPVPAAPVVGIAGLRAKHPNGGVIEWREHMHRELAPPMRHREHTTNV